MIKVDYSRRFIKQYRKLPDNHRNKFETRLSLWQTNPANPILNVRQLQGNYKGYFSLNVTDDLRAIYKWSGNTLILFDFIGTHSQLYG